MTCPLPRGVDNDPRVPTTSTRDAEVASELGVDIALARRVIAQENLSFTGSAFYMPVASAAGTTTPTPRPLRISAAFIARAGGKHPRHALFRAGYTEDAGALVSPVDQPGLTAAPAKRGPVRGSRRSSRRRRRGSVRSNPSVRVGLDASTARAPASASPSRCRSPESPDSPPSRIDSAPMSVRNLAAPAPALALELQRIQDRATATALQLRLLTARLHALGLARRSSGSTSGWLTSPLPRSEPQNTRKVRFASSRSGLNDRYEPVPTDPTLFTDHRLGNALRRELRVPLQPKLVRVATGTTSAPSGLGVFQNPSAPKVGSAAFAAPTLASASVPRCCSSGRVPATASPALGIDTAPAVAPPSLEEFEAVQMDAAYLSAVAAEAPSMARAGAVAAERSSAARFSVSTCGAVDDDMERLHRQNYLSMAAFIDSLESFEGSQGKSADDGPPRTHDELTAATMAAMPSSDSTPPPPRAAASKPSVP